MRRLRKLYKIPEPSHCVRTEVGDDLWLMLRMVDWARCRARCKVDWARCRVDWARCRVDWARCRVDWARCRVDWARCRVDWARCRVD